MKQFANALALLAIGLCFQLNTCEETEEFTHIVELKHGKVNGKFQEVDGGKKVEFFQGIKYGQAKRFEKPQPVHPWTYVYPATSLRDGCPQFGNIPGLDEVMVNMTKTFSEDCLYLNLWRPHEVKENRPVMVFIHGGSFLMGTIFTDIFNARNIANVGDLIVVTINYRLGPLGFANGGSSTPNLGLHDQIFALKWIQENIHAFGGNPNDVTIFGESAGSISVGALVLSPLAKGLFHRAIMQSGAPVDQFVTESLSRSHEKTVTLAKKVNCSADGKLEQAMQCLKSKSVKELQTASLQKFDPVYGDEVLPIKPADALKTGKFNHVDLIYGVNRDEGTVFASQLVPEVGQTNNHFTVESARNSIIKLMTTFRHEKSAKEIADFYLNKLSKNPTQDDFKVAISSVWGDFHLGCPTILFAEEFARHAPTSKIYSYRLMQSVTLPNSKDPAWFGVSHGQDIIYLFMSQMLKTSPAHYQLSQDMIHAWTAFAKTGKPTNMGGSVVWEEAFNRSALDFTTCHMHLEWQHYKMVPEFFKNTCDTFWKSKILV